MRGKNHMRRTDQRFLQRLYGQCISCFAFGTLTEGRMRKWLKLCDLLKTAGRLMLLLMLREVVVL